MTAVLGIAILAVNYYAVALTVRTHHIVGVGVAFLYVIATVFAPLWFFAALFIIPRNLWRLRHSDQVLR